MTSQFSLGVTWSGSFVNHRQRVSRDRIDVAFGSMNGWEKRWAKLASGDTVRFLFTCQLSAGELSVELIGPDGRVLIHWGDKSPSVDDFVAQTTGKYEIRTTGKRASGNYKLEIGASNHQQT